MSITTISSRTFNRDVGKAKKAAQTGPVIITDRGQPAYVLMHIDQYRQVTGNKRAFWTYLPCPAQKTSISLRPACKTTHITPLSYYNVPT